MKLERTGSVWDRSNRNAINNNWGRLEGIMKNINDLVIQGRLTPNQYSQLIKELNGLISKGQVSVHDIDKNKGLLDQSFLSEELLEQISGTAPVLSTLANGVVTTQKLANKAVTPDKTNFFDIGDNIFDGAYQNGMITRHLETDELRLMVNYSGYQGKTAVIPIEPNTTYTIETDGDASNIFRVATDSRRLEFTDSNNATFFENSQVHSSVGDNVYSATVTTTETDRYMYVYVSNEGREPSLNVSSTTLKQDIIPPLKGPVVSPENTTFFVGGDNIFGGVYQDGMVTRNLQTNELRLRVNYSGYQGKTAVIPIEPNTAYEVNVLDHQQSNILRVATDSRHLEFTVSNDGTTFENSQLHSSEGDGIYYTTVTTSASDKYMYVYVSNEGKEPNLNVSEVSKIPRYYLSLEGFDDKASPKDPIFNFSGDFNHLYEHSEISNVISNIKSVKTNTVNNLFKTLVNQNDDIGRSTNLGMDDSGVATYMFESKPPAYNDAPYVSNTKPEDGTPMRLPKIMITSGIHGSEKSPPISIYYFLKTLWENPDNDPNIDALVQNVHFIFVPIVGPEGYDSGTYNNGTINLNRDFPPHGNAVKKSTQYVKDVMVLNQDMDYFIDLHNMFGRDDMLGYVLTNDELWKRIGTNIYKDIGARWAKKDSSIPSERNHKFAVATQANAGTIGRYAQDVIGTQAALLEIPRKNPFNLNEDEYGEHIVRLGVDILFNAVYSAIRYKQ